MVKKRTILVGFLVMVLGLTIGVTVLTKGLDQETISAENILPVKDIPPEVIEGEPLNTEGNEQSVDPERWVRIIPAEEVERYQWDLNGMKSQFLIRQPNGIIEEYTASDNNKYYLFISAPRVEEKEEIIQRLEKRLAEMKSVQQTPEQQKEAIREINEVFGEREVKYIKASEYADDKGFLYLVEDGKIILKQINDMGTIRTLYTDIFTTEGRFTGGMTLSEKKAKAIELLNKIEGDAKANSIKETMGEKALYDGITVFYWKEGRDLSKVNIDELRDYDILISVEGARGMVIQYQNFVK